MKKQSLIVTNPEILKKWDYEKNEEKSPSEYTKGSNEVVWWKCEKGHSWKAKIRQEINRKHNCPYYANDKVWKGYNDLETTNPILV